MSKTKITTTMREARIAVRPESRMPLIASGVPKSSNIALIGLVIGALSLSGCASAGIQGPSTSPSATATDQVPLGASVFNIGCEDVATAEGLTSVFGAEPVLATDPSSGVRPAQVFVTALEQDGALTCEWGRTYEAPSIALIALPEAADGFRHYGPALSASGYYSELDIFDGSFYHCNYGLADQPLMNCDWQVLAEDVWVTVTLTGVLDAAFDTRPTPTSSQSLAVSEHSAVVEFLSATVGAIVQAPRLEPTRSTTTVGSCSELIDAAAIAASLPGEIEVHDVLAPGEIRLGLATSREGDPMWAISMQRLGYRYCSVTPPPGDGIYATTVLVAPGGSWAFDQSEAQTIDGLGSAISECINTGDGPRCFVAVIIGDTLVSIQSYEATPVLSLAIAKSIVAGLG